MAGPKMTLHCLGHVEGRLVARAQQVVGLLLVQRNRATDVGADLGVGDDSVVRPVLAPGDVELLGFRRISSTTDLAFSSGCPRAARSGLRDDVESGTDGDVRGLDRRTIRIAGEPHVSCRPGPVPTWCASEESPDRWCRSQDDEGRGVGSSDQRPMRLLRSRGRRGTRLLVGVLKTSTASARVAAGLPSRVTLVNPVVAGMMAFAQCTVPMPTASSDNVIPTPTNIVCKRMSHKSPDSIGKNMYASTAPKLPAIET